MFRKSTNANFVVASHNTIVCRKSTSANLLLASSCTVMVRKSIVVNFSDSWFCCSHCFTCSFHRLAGFYSPARFALCVRHNLPKTKKKVNSAEFENACFCDRTFLILAHVMSVVACDIEASERQRARALAGAMLQPARIINNQQ